MVSPITAAAFLICVAPPMPALAQPSPPALLLQQGDVPDGSPDGRLVASIRSTRATASGGFAAMVGLRDAAPPRGDPVDAVWGLVPGESGPRVLVYEHAFQQGSLSFEQVRFEDTFGFSALGQVVYSALLPAGTCSPMATAAGYLDSVWAGGALLETDGGPAPASPALLYRFLSDPGVTAGGDAYWHGGASPLGQGLPTWEALFIATASGMVPWLQTGLTVDGGTLSSLGPLTVSTLGTFALGVATLQNGDHLLVRGEWSEEDGSPVVLPVTFGGAAVRTGRSLIAQGALSGEKWDRLLHVDAGESGSPGMPPHWLILAQTTAPAGRRHAVVMSNGLLNFVACREGEVYPGGRTLTGRPEHVAINPQGDLASVWSVAPSGKEALFLNGGFLIETGDPVPLRDGGGGATGVLTNILGVNTVSISGRDSGGVVSVYFIGSVAPDAAPDPLGRAIALYRIDVAVSTGKLCGSDWDLSGSVNSSDISAYLSAWLADLAAVPPTTLADFNNDGATNSSDISAFLSAWLTDVNAGC